jgi:hypothetical protein
VNRDRKDKNSAVFWMESVARDGSVAEAERLFNEKIDSAVALVWPGKQIYPAPIDSLAFSLSGKFLEKNKMSLAHAQLFDALSSWDEAMVIQFFKPHVMPCITELENHPTMKPACDDKALSAVCDTITIAVARRLSELMHMFFSMGKIKRLNVAFDNEFKTNPPLKETIESAIGDKASSVFTGENFTFKVDEFLKTFYKTVESLFVVFAHNSMRDKCHLAKAAFSVILPFQIDMYVANAKEKDAKITDSEASEMAQKMRAAVCGLCNTLDGVFTVDFFNKIKNASENIVEYDEWSQQQSHADFCHK